MLLFLTLLLPLTYCSVFSSQPQISSQQNQLAYQYAIFQNNCVQKYNDIGLTQIPIQCAVYTISQIFNIILIPLCLILRVPQIYKIIKNRSVYGLSYIGNNLQLLMTCMTLAYGIYVKFSFWIYGEIILLSIQNLVILGLFFIYDKDQGNLSNMRYVTLIIPLIFTLILSTMFIMQMVPNWCQQASIWLQLLILFGARGAQIINNYQYKTTQNLSSRTVFITLFTNFARTITILVQAPHSTGYLMNYLIPIFINGIIGLQIYLYSNEQYVQQKNYSKMKYVNAKRQ